MGKKLKRMMIKRAFESVAVYDNKYWKYFPNMDLNIHSCQGQ